MAWEYYGDELIIIGVLTTILLIAVLNFLKSRFKRRLVFSLTLLLVGYVSCIIGLVFVRGWDALGWILIGFSLYVIGLLTYIGVVIYHWVKGRRTTNS
ncbi:YesK family protein [Exiguobacterium sp. s7]|uniref:YesK family protein n=1 Tax=Exiguobacterium sp. s7 TaxID=2751235 RepID=UPI001BEB8F9D|nr:YesK family protein [Exiguobacterium sp. s7]